MKELIKEIFCRLGLHYWVYPKKSLEGERYAKGAYRYCKACKYEQVKIMFGPWAIKTA